jgi:hypothetical protein
MKSGTLSIAVIAFLGLGLLVIVALFLTAPVHASQATDAQGARLDVRQPTHVQQVGAPSATARRFVSP